MRIIYPIQTKQIKNTKGSCEIAGCCWNTVNDGNNPWLIALNLYYNSEITDNVVSTNMPQTNEYNYTFVRIQGYIFSNNQTVFDTYLISINLFLEFLFFIYTFVKLFNTFDNNHNKKKKKKKN